MSLHKSLKQKNALERRRNVLKRDERVERLKEDEKWEEKQSVFGLPKVKPAVVVAPASKRKAKEEAKKAEAEAEE